MQAIVTDLATAFDLTSTELPHTTIVGQFNAPGGDNWGLLLSLALAVDACVDRAVAALRANGTLAKLSEPLDSVRGERAGPALSATATGSAAKS